ncbi:DUF5719 family protein [Actinocorallia sp. API 0066]|nr:DUF5719 family protein [Actinocorallia sp. API 0066]
MEAAHTVVGKRGVESAPCTAPGTEHWFVTPGPGDGPLDLHVTNVDDAPASVDLEAISDDGSLDTTDGKALEIPPRSTRVIGIGETLDGLGPIASDARVMALRVTATSGRVAAAVHADAGRRGLDWATAAAPPARHVIVPGVPGGSGTRTLFVGTPSRDDARVEIRVITADGVFAPEGQGLLDVPAGTVIPVDLEAALGGKPAAVELRSTKPLVAGLAAGGYDLGLGASAVPLDGGTTAVGALPAAGATRVKAAARETASVVLTAPERDAVVEITPLVPGQGAPAEVRIPAGRTVEVPFTATAVRIVPKAGSGPVYGARVLTVKAGQRRDHRTVRTLVPAPLEIRLPPVSDSLTSVIP